MSAMREQIILEKTVTTENGRTVLRERNICGIVDTDGVFHLRAYCGRRFSFRQESTENRSKAA